MGLSRGRNISKKTTEDLYYLQSLQVQHDKFLCHHPYLSLSSKAYSSRRSSYKGMQILEREQQNICSRSSLSIKYVVQ